MKVLMTTDGSVHASGAMLTASRLLRQKNLEVDVVCVAPEITLEPPKSGSHLRRSFKEHSRGRPEDFGACPSENERTVGGRLARRPPSRIGP